VKVENAKIVINLVKLVLDLVKHIVLDALKMI
jgi:hypothetical protein